MSSKAKILLPLVVLAVGGLAAVAIVRARPKVERQETAVLPPLVRVIEVSKEDRRLDVSSQGTVAPLVESDLVAEVAGRLDWVSPSFAEGGFFRRGETLLRIDDRDYGVAFSQAEAGVAQARVRLELELAEAELARQEWKDLGEGDPSSLALREPQLAETRAALQAAEGTLEKARLDLERTRIAAPFDGRVLTKLADLGQFVSRGTRLGTVYSTDAAELRLPVSKQELVFLDVDLGIQDEGSAADGPEVELRGDMGGRTYVWSARVVRTGGAFDPRTRMLPLFARVEDPFGRLPPSAGPPLPMGLFVEAEIAGRLAEEVIVLPRSAVRDGSQVLVVDDESRLRFRTIDILRTHRDEVVVEGGLETGELVCVSPLEAVVDGMAVRTLLETEPEETEVLLEERS
jgi:RND family efflux transporter MFP subunit